MPFLSSSETLSFINSSWYLYYFFFSLSKMPLTFTYITWRTYKTSCSLTFWTHFLYSWWVQLKSSTPTIRAFGGYRTFHWSWTITSWTNYVFFYQYFSLTSLCCKHKAYFNVHSYIFTSCMIVHFWRNIFSLKTEKLIKFIFKILLIICFWLLIAPKIIFFWSCISWFWSCSCVLILWLIFSSSSKTPKFSLLIIVILLVVNCFLLIIR